jgi:esterase/lipase superfamily enzyme
MFRQLLFIIPVTLAASLASGQTNDLISAYQHYEDARSRGDFAAASEFARESLEVTGRQTGTDSAEYAVALERLGRALAKSGPLNEAANYLRKALDAKADLLDPGHPDLLELLESLTDVFMEQGELAAAQATLKRVLEIESSAYGKQHENTISTMRRIEALYRQQGNAADADAMKAEIRRAGEVTRTFDPMGGDDDGFSLVKVFYGTNRSRSGSDRASDFYGTGRGELELGYVEVSIPKTHKYGQLESESWMSVLVGEEAKKRKYVLLQSVRPLDHDVFYDNLRDAIDGAKSNDVFLFVHGYNVAFTKAARRAAQLAYDLDFDGTPMMYSWPSQASTAAYTVDEAVVRPSGRKLAKLLDGVVAQTGAERIHLIAHSMGNRALLEALQAYAVKNGQEASRNTFDQIVFTAPDVDRDYFIDVMDSLGGIARRTTLYASENDVALKSSRILHGAPRAGLAGDALVVLPGIDTIDMSGVEADILGHSYFAANEGAIYDLFRLFWLGDAPPDRCGMNQQQLAGLGFWTFDVDNCRGGEILQAGVLWKRFGVKARDRIRERMAQLTNPDQETEKEEWSRILDKLNSLIKPNRYNAGSPRAPNAQPPGCELL